MVSGGAGIGGNIYMGGNLNMKGNLFVEGTEQTAIVGQTNIFDTKDSV